MVAWPYYITAVFVILLIVLLVMRSKAKA